MLELFVGIHSKPQGLAGTSITVATQAFCRPPWVLGPSHPATHAFVSWTHGDGVYYRLDAQPGGAQQSLWAGPRAVSDTPTANWKINQGTAEGHQKAIQLVGIPYDFFEIGAQLLPIPGLAAGLDFAKGAMICTHLTTTVMDACGSSVRKAVDELRNRYPESLGQMLKANEDQPWLTRVS